MAKYNKTFKKNPKYTHNRSEGLTRRGEARQERLQTGSTRPRWTWVTFPLTYPGVAAYIKVK